MPVLQWKNENEDISRYRSIEFSVVLPKMQTWNKSERSAIKYGLKRWARRIKRRACFLIKIGCRLFIIPQQYGWIYYREVQIRPLRILGWACVSLPRYTGTKSAETEKDTLYYAVIPDRKSCWDQFEVPEWEETISPFWDFLCDSLFSTLYEYQSTSMWSATSLWLRPRSRRALLTISPSICM